MKRLLFVPVALAALAASCGGADEGGTAADPGIVIPEDTLFITVPGGTFTNSSGETVNVETFSIMAHEVCNRFYADAARDAHIEFPPDPRFPGVSDYTAERPDHPVVNVSPDEASRLASSLGMRLPTRNEWEYAASRGLSGAIGEQFTWGTVSPGMTPEFPANFLANGDWEQRDADGFAFTAPCGSFPLSQSGLADLCGNVAEMVRDDSAFVLKGGSWTQPEDAMTIGWNRVITSGDRCWYAGFRFAR